MSWRDARPQRHLELVSFSLCRPTLFVRKALVGTNIRESINRHLVR